MPKSKLPTVSSLERAGELQTMEVETAHRWSCSCGEKGPWETRSMKAISLGGRDRSKVQPAEMARLLKDWEAHVADRHGDADLTFDEWEPEEDPE